VYNKTVSLAGLQHTHTPVKPC